MKKYNYIFLFCLVFEAHASALTTSKCNAEDSLAFVHRLNIGPFAYRMKFDRDTAQARFEISRKGKVLFSRSGSHFYVNPGLPCGLPIAGTSLTKQHRSELVVEDWDGGAHCCNTLYIIALDDCPHLIQKLELEHSSLPIFQDLNGDGIPEIVIEDWTFAYWKVPFAQSPSPEVILSYNGKKWTFDRKLNKRPPPSKTTLFKLKRAVIQNFRKVPHDPAFGDTEDTGAPVRLWEEMLKLIYSGNAPVAFHLVDTTWPTTNYSKRKFLRQFCSELSGSPFFSQLNRMNKGNLFRMSSR